MRADIYVPSLNTEAQVNFYVHELGLFEIHRDYGMGDILLRCLIHPSFCLQLYTASQPITGPLFSLSIANCQTEFERLRAISFTHGGIVPDRDGTFSLLEYPLGKTFSLRDASGNLFALTQWHASAL